MLIGWVGLAGVLSQEPALPAGKGCGQIEQQGAELPFQCNVGLGVIMETFWGEQSTELRGPVLQKRNIHMGFFQLFCACLRVATSLTSSPVFVPPAGRRSVGVPASFQGFCFPPPAGVYHAAAAAEAVPALRVPARQ